MCLNGNKGDQEATTHNKHLVFLFFYVNGSITWYRTLYEWILNFKSFPIVPRTPNLESGLESYDLGKLGVQI